MNWLRAISLLAAVWTGFVLAISFMESWLKFRAKGVTLTIGLSIGNLIFRTLNRVEWFILVLIGIAVFSSGMVTGLILVSTVLLSAILLTQAFILLPVLSRRAKQLISGKPVKKSGVHLAFISAETLKVVILVCLCVTAMT